MLVTIRDYGALTDDEVALMTRLPSKRVRSQLNDDLDKEFLESRAENSGHDLALEAVGGCEQRGEQGHHA